MKEMYERRDFTAERWGISCERRELVELVAPRLRSG